MEVEIDGVKYWQPECHCTGSGHICYLRPMPVAVKLSAEGMRRLTGGSANIKPKRKLAPKATHKD